MVDAETGAQMIDQQLRDEAGNLVFAGYELNMRWLICQRRPVGIPPAGRACACPTTSLPRLMPPRQ
jgi:hypothetical protein